MNSKSSPPGIIRLTSILDRLDLHNIFPAAQPLQVELGAGDGTFLVSYAQTRPDFNFIGVERLAGRLHKIARKAVRARLQNVRAIRVESAYFLEFLLPQESVTAVHVYFPDPWPKRRHARNRLVNERFPQICERALANDGRVYLRTDDRPYFEAMVDVFSRSASFAPEPSPPELLSIRTDFEMEFNARGIPTLHAAFVKRFPRLGDYPLAGSLTQCYNPTGCLRSTLQQNKSARGRAPGAAPPITPYA